MTTRPVLLVHGAWHGRWCWGPVQAALTARGVRAEAVDLPGHGDDTGALGDLHDDAARVRAALDAFDEPVVLVGHSYGGVVVTEAGVHPNVAALVYLAAFNLDAGESTMSVAIAASATAALDQTGRPDVLAHLRVGDDGISTVDPAGARLLFYNDCADDVAAWAGAQLGPQPMATMMQTPDAVAWRHRPSMYAVCTLDNIVHPELQRILARRSDRVVEWATGHSPFLSRPDLVSELLATVAADPAAS